MVVVIYLINALPSARLREPREWRGDPGCLFSVFASHVSGAAIRGSLPCHSNLHQKRNNKCQNLDRRATFGGSRRRTLEVCISRQCIVPSPVFFAYFAYFAVKPSLPRLREPHEWRGGLVRRSRVPLPRLCEPPKAAWQSRVPPIVIFFDRINW